MRNKKKIIRACTVPQSIGFFKEVMLKMRADGYESVVVTSPGKDLDDFKEEIKDEGLRFKDEGLKPIRCIAVPMERHISLKNDIVSLFRMIRVFMKERPYVVHSMTPKAGLICMMAAWLTRVPVRIHTFTGLVWPTAVGTKRKILMLTDKILCACATHIIPEGEGVKNDLQAYITKKPMKVLGYGNCRGVDMSYWRRNEELEMRSEELRREWFADACASTSEYKRDACADSFEHELPLIDHVIGFAACQQQEFSVNSSSNGTQRRRAEGDFSLNTEDTECTETLALDDGTQRRRAEGDFSLNTEDTESTETLALGDVPQITQINTEVREKKFVFLFVGRVVGDKGINELVEAFLKLREHYLSLDNGQKIRLVLVGPYENNLDPVSKLTQDRIDNTPSILAVGAQHGKELLAHYAASDCFVFPSYREGFPNTVLEAGAMGLPQIVTDINGSREIITASLPALPRRESAANASTERCRICDNGIIIPSKDAEALYEAMKMMVESCESKDEGLRIKDGRSLYQVMAENARPMIESRFEKNFVQKCQMDFYDEILK